LNYDLSGIHATTKSMYFSAWWFNQLIYGILENMLKHGTVDQLSILYTDQKIIFKNKIISKIAKEGNGTRAIKSIYDQLKIQYSSSHR
jgi:hypothetical protein